MPDHSFFQNMHRYFTRVDSAVDGAYYLTSDGNTPIEGMFIVYQKHVFEIVFDMNVWQTKKGVSFTKLEYIQSVGLILLDPSVSQYIEGLPDLCLKRLQPKVGSELVLPERIVLKYDPWVTASWP
jgi:hypothetical protein